MDICPTDYCERKLMKMLKMSMVPLPCQEYRLGSKNSILSEDLEWLLDLNDRIPIWSRINTLNTSGYNRKLPMSMARYYDIEIKGRLWSMWGHMTYKKQSISCRHKYTKNKPYLASAVLALCAARTFRLNIWTPQLMDNIAIDGKKYLMESLKNFHSDNFQLENLACECCLEGIRFEVRIHTCEHGCLYGVPLEGSHNLAYALINFFKHKEFGILECCNRFLAFGYKQGPDGGYFMFDFATIGHPIFPTDVWAPYMLRTNHLQVLLYCLVITLNIAHRCAEFCIHYVDIDIVNPEPSEKCTDEIEIKTGERILSDSCWDTPVSTEASELCSQTSQKDVKVILPPPAKLSDKYLRVVDSEPDMNVQDMKIKRNVETKKTDFKESHSFVKMICSGTVVPLTYEEMQEKVDKSFVIPLTDAMFMH